MSKTTFHYRPLTNKQLAKMVLELTKEMIEIRKFTGTKLGAEMTEKAQKMINRARLEGIL